MMHKAIFERRLQPSPSLLRPLRHEITRSLDGAVGEPVRNDVLLLVSELCTNAMEASNGRSCEIVVRIDLTHDDCVVVEVEDCGDGFALNRRRAEDHDEAGRGLAIAKALAKQVEVDRSEERTHVRAWLRRYEAFKLSGDFQ